MKNKTVWITGGKRIGQVVAKFLAENGANIIASYRSSSDEADQIVNVAKSFGVKALAVKCDVSSKESVDSAVKIISENFIVVDVLLNMASVFSPVKFDDISEKDWKNNFDAHVLGTFWPSQAVSKIMPRGGHIINIADRTSLGKIYSGYLPYVVTKSAVANMTKALAVELASKGIFVNAIAPGPILRPDDISVLDWQSIRDTSPLQFPIDDNEAVSQFANAVLYLCSVTMASGYVFPLDQGQNL